MSFFLLLLFINTLLFATFVCLPNASPFLKQMWTDWHAARDKKRDAQAERAKVNACLDHTLPPDQVVYAEDPAEITRLLAGAGRAHIVSDSPSFAVTGGPFRGGGGGGDGLFGGGGGGGGTPREREKMLAQTGGREPAVFGRTSTLVRLDDQLRQSLPMPATATDSLVFLHLVKTPAGKPRLVWISVGGDASL